MYEFYLNTNRHTMKNKWEELNADEFLFLFELLQQYKEGELSVGDVRTQMVLRLFNVDKVKIRTREQESHFTENIYRLQSQLRFVFRIEYDDERFASLSPALKKTLSRCEPEATSPNAEERLACRFKRHYEIDSVFCRNLIPDIAGIPGYRLDNDSGILVSDLTASRFCDAVTISDAFIRSGSIQQLNTLVSILYFDGVYESSTAHQRARFFECVPKNIKECVFFNFQSILSFIYNQTKYRVLFGRGHQKTSPYNGGLSASLLSMGKRFGGVQAVGNAGLIDFLEMMLDSLIEYVRELNAMDKSLSEIASKTKLDVKTINDML